MSHSLRNFARGLAAASIAVGLYAATACSSNDDKGPPGLGDVAPSLASSFCGALGSCCDAAKHKYDGASCKAQMTAQFQRAADDYKRGSVIYDSAAVAGCAEALRARQAACSDDAGAPTADAGYLDAVAAACWGVFRGTLEPGAECTSSAQCKSPGPSVSTSCTTRSGSSGPNAKKVCIQYVRHVLPGGECTAVQAPGESVVVSSCEPTEGYCSAEAGATKGRCTPYAKVGDSCVGTPGAPAPTCDFNTSYCDYAQTQKCTALGQAGDTCGGSARCGSGLYCDSATRVCAASKRAGESCTQSSECASSNCERSFNPDGGATTGVCVDTGSSSTIYHVSPRTCGFGPMGSGPDDAGIVQQSRGLSDDDLPWYQRL